MTEILTPDAAGLTRAAEILRAGGLVAFPTETVYGLGADAADDRAVAALYQAKGRPPGNPLIAHAPDLAAAERIARFDATARRLAAAFWPGPLTLVLPRRVEARLAARATAGLDTIGVRAPAHPVAEALLRAVGRPLAAPSANPSGGVSPTTADHVLAGLSGRIDAVIDGGPCAVGLESTIVKPEPAGLRLLRPGGVPREAIEAALGAALRQHDRGAEARSGGDAALEAPGQLSSHYAPGVRLRLDAAAPAPGEGWLGFGPADPWRADPAREDPPRKDLSREDLSREAVSPEALSRGDFSRGDLSRAETSPAARRNLSPSGDLGEAAANLFAALRALDREMGGAGTVAVAAIPETGLGVAINDRLRRAAAPRSSS